MSLLKHCRCERPARVLTADGVSHCDRCGEILPERVEDAMPHLIAAVAQLREEIGAKNGNGHREPKLALTKTEAAEALAVSVDFLEQHILHELRLIRRGRRILIPAPSWSVGSTEARNRPCPPRDEGPLEPLVRCPGRPGCPALVRRGHLCFDCRSKRKTPRLDHNRKETK